MGKLSDVIAAVEKTAKDVPELVLNSYTTVADGSKVKVYMKNFGEFYNNQIESAGTIILSRTQKLSQEKLEAAVALLREKNAEAAIITTPWDQIDGKAILSAVEKVSLADELMEEMHHHHHHHDHDEECTCGCHDHDHEHHHHHHDHDEECCCHEHHHDHEECHHEHHHDEDCCCHEHHDHDECCHEHHHDHEHHEHHHHHEHEEHCTCGCHEHDHHHHHADEVFTSWGVETVKIFTESELRRILTALDSGEYGAVLRAKGIVSAEGSKWLHFDYVPEEHEVRYGAADYTGRLCVIGSKLNEHELHHLFGL